MRGAPVSYLDYSGGRNTQNAPYLLSEGECRDQLNTHTSLSGDIEKRPGFVTFNGSSLTGAPINGTLVHTLFPSNTSTKSLIGVSRTSTTDTIFKLTTAGVASALKTGLTANKRWDIAQADLNAGEGPIFLMNGIDKPQRWNGSAAATSDWVATTGTVPPKARFLTYFASRLWCAEGSRLWYSGLTGSTPDPMSWDANNYVDLDPNDGQEITGIGVVGADLIVFKHRKTFKIYDTINGANLRVSSEIGCVAHRSIVQTPAGLLFLSEDQGVCQTNGESVKPFSDQIQPDLLLVAQNPETAAQAAGCLDGRRYYLSVSLGGTRNDHTLEYDLIKGSWWLHSCASNQFARLDPSGTPVLYSADSTTTARVSQAFVEGVYTDNGAVYSGGSYWTSPWRAWGVGGRGLNPHVRKQVNELRVDGVGNWRVLGAVEFQDAFEELEGEVWEASQDESGTFAGTEDTFGAGATTTFGASPDAVVYRRYYTPLVPARAFSFKFVDETDQNFAIHSSTALLTPRTD